MQLPTLVIDKMSSVLPGLEPVLGWGAPGGGPPHKDELRCPPLPWAPPLRIAWVYIQKWQRINCDPEGSALCSLTWSPWQQKLIGEGVLDE